MARVRALLTAGRMTPRPRAVHLFFLLVALTAACSTSHPGDDGGALEPCPVAAPADGAPCTSPHLRCVYERCATVGVVSAQCTPGDGGASSWSVASRACADTCGGSMCAAGTVCAERIAGALLLECRAHACCEGPLDCECACGPGVECTISGGADDAVFGCYAGCGAAICP